jgi:hypothetical protein
MDDCDHPPAPETCSRCDKDVVVSINDVGACGDHIDEVFGEAAVPLGMILMAASESFGEGTTLHGAP